MIFLSTRELRESCDAVNMSHEAARKASSASYFFVVSRLIFGASQKEEKSRKTSGTRVSKVQPSLYLELNWYKDIVRNNTFNEAPIIDLWSKAW